MASRSNPFLKNQISAPNTFLLNYGEENLTLYHALTRIPTPNRTPNTRAQLNVLDRMQKQAYSSPSANIEQQSEHSLLSQTSSMKQLDPLHSNYFWNCLPKPQPPKLLINPFINSQSYSEYGLIASRGKPSSEFKPQLRRLSSQKQLIRRQFSELKQTLKNNSKKVRDPNGPTSSLTNLYKYRRGPQSNSQIGMENAQQFTFHDSYLRAERRP